MQMLQVYLGVFFVKNGASVINDIEKENPDGSNLKISRPQQSNNASPRPLVRKTTVLSKY